MVKACILQIKLFVHLLLPCLGGLGVETVSDHAILPFLQIKEDPVRSKYGLYDKLHTKFIAKRERMKRKKKCNVVEIMRDVMQLGTSIWFNLIVQLKGKR